MDDQKKKAIVASILGTFALGAVGYVAFGRSDKSTVDSDAAVDAASRVQRVVLADTEPMMRHEVRTLATTERTTDAVRKSRRTGTASGKNKRLVRHGSKRIERVREKDSKPAA